jgi:predicted RNA binding protein YcfA (HicA-like mRNA interferase family)
MANALKELLEVLGREKLPHDYPIRKVSTAMKSLGYAETIRGSHYKWRKPGEHPVVISEWEKKVPQDAMKDLKVRFKRLGLL